MAETPLLQVSGLTVGFKTDDGIVRAATDVSFEIAAGETLAVVGESGSGKSVTALAIMRLHPNTAVITGEVMYGGQNLVTLPDEEMRSIRNDDIAMIFQDPMTALNPVFTVGSQIVEAIRIHQKVSKQAAWDRAVELLELVGVPEPKRRSKQYPHEFSGGMRQRAMIAMAISNNPKLLIADEPTTALDVTVQAQVMEVIADVQRETGAAVMLITHDLGLVAGSANRVQVMYASRIVETGSLDQIFYESSNPYTQALIASIPSAASRVHERLRTIPGNPPSLLNPPSGCPFRPRCSQVIHACADEVPTLLEVGDSHFSRCIRSVDVRMTSVGSSPAESGDT
jgi:peptide/nickel transport system ATP-binding protein